MRFQIGFDPTGLMPDASPVRPLPADPRADRPAQARVRLPFEGLWWAGNAPNTELGNHHPASPAQRHAFDFVVWRDGATYRGDGRANADYWAWKQPVVSPAAGTVVSTQDGVADNRPGVTTNPTAILTAGGDAGQDLATAEGVRSVFSAAGAGTAVVLLLGIVVMTGERQHHTVTQTVLSTPARQRVVAAKMAATAMASAGLAVAASALTLLIALPWLAAKSVEVAPLSGDVAGVLAGSIGATVLYGMIGVAVGAVVRSQLAAVALSLVWTLVVEALLVALLPKVGRWLPGGAADALSRAATPRGGLLPVWGGAALLVAYVVGAALVGSRLFVKADVT